MTAEMESKQAEARAHRTRNMTITLSEDMQSYVSQVAEIVNTSSSRVFDALVRDGLEYRKINLAQSSVAARLEAALAQVEGALGIEKQLRCDVLSEAKLLAGVLAARPKACALLDVLRPEAFVDPLHSQAWEAFGQARGGRGRPPVAPPDRGLVLDVVATTMARLANGERERARVRKQVVGHLEALAALGHYFDADAPACAHRLINAALVRSAAPGTEETLPPDEILSKLRAMTAGLSPVVGGAA
ncbi:MAG: hypothetical protein ACOYLQ_08020 [Hyphomicrobiaceae bacterium]